MTKHALILLWVGLKINKINTENQISGTVLNHFPAIPDKCCLISHLIVFLGSLYIANNMDPDQTALLGAV